MNISVRKREQNIANKDRDDKRNEDLQGIANHHLGMEFAEGLARAGLFSRYGGREAVGVMFVLAHRIKITG